MRHILDLYLIFMIFPSIIFGQNPSPVRTVTVIREKIAEIKSVTGSLRAALISDIAAAEDGRIDELLVKEGQRVTKGDLLAKLDSRRIVHEMNVLKAQVHETKARIERFKNELTIYEDEYKSLVSAEKGFNGSVSRQEFRDTHLQKVTTEGEIATLEASLSTFQARLNSLDTSLEDTEIKAAFDGVIIQKFVEQGFWVDAGDKVVTLMNDQKLEAWLDIPEFIDPKFLKKELISVEANNSSLTITKIVTIPQVNERSRNYKLVVEVDGLKHSLLPGMSVTASVPNGLFKEQLLIPTDAISRNGAGYFVFKAKPTPDGAIALPINIEILFRHGPLAAIRSEMLEPSDAVITEGNERLFPMMPITVLAEEKK